MLVKSYLTLFFFYKYQKKVNYARAGDGSIFGISSIKTDGGFGLAGKLNMYDATTPYYDPDVSSTPQRMVSSAVWKAPSNGTFTFYLLLLAHDGAGCRINQAWNDGGWNYERGKSCLCLF